MNAIKAYAHYQTFLAKHQVYTNNGMIEIMADGKKDARAIAESCGHKVMFVTRFV